MQEQDHVLYAPAEAERQLGVKGSTLRNYAKAYEQVFEPLPRGGRGERLWSVEALERLSAARTLHQDGKAVSLELALELIARGDAEVSTVLTRANEPTFEEAVISRLEALTRAVEALQGENIQLREQLKALTSGPTEPDGDEEVRQELQIHLDEERKRTWELQHRVEYLQALLAKHDAEAEPKRPWWRRLLG